MGRYPLPALVFHQLDRASFPNAKTPAVQFFSASTDATAVPTTTPIVGTGGLQGGGPLNDGAALQFYAPSTWRPTCRPPASARVTGPTPTSEASGHGTGVPCFWSNGVWNAVTSGAAVTTWDLNRVDAAAPRRRSTNTHAGNGAASRREATGMGDTL